jgi:hypothetical protein
MRALARTMIIRDRAGYEVRDYGEPAAGGTLMTAKPSGIHIMGKSGVNDNVWISAGGNYGLWQQARSLDTPLSVAKFMGKWGQLSRWLTDDGNQRYDEAYLLIEPYLKSIRYLAGFVDTGDKLGFGKALNKQVLLSRADITIDVDDSDLPLVIEARSLLQFMILEMWSEFGGDRPARVGFRTCGHCGRAFRVGGRRGTRARRADAHFCSDSCKNMASRVRKTRRNPSAIPRQ